MVSINRNFGGMNVANTQQSQQETVKTSEDNGKTLRKTDVYPKEEKAAKPKEDTGDTGYFEDGTRTERGDFFYGITNIQWFEMQSGL